MIKSKRFEFTIGSVFPIESEIARFVTRLGIISNDLSLILKSLDESYKGQINTLAGYRLYFFFLACSHFREAAKVIDKELQNENIKTFLQELDDDAKQRLDRIIKSFTPWRGSFVESKLKPIRESFFHYIHDAEIIRGLKEISAQKGGVDLGHEGKYLEIRYDFADEVVVNVFAPLFGDNEEEIKKTFKTVSSLIVDYIYFSHKAVSHYLRKLPKHLFTKTS